MKIKDIEKEFDEDCGKAHMSYGELYYPASFVKQFYRNKMKQYALDLVNKCEFGAPPIEGEVLTVRNNLRQEIRNKINEKTK